jgi:hypothetical protein
VLHVTVNTKSVTCKGEHKEKVTCKGETKSVTCRVSTNSVTCKSELIVFM